MDVRYSSLYVFVSVVNILVGYIYIVILVLVCFIWIYLNLIIKYNVYEEDFIVV